MYDRPRPAAQIHPPPQAAAGSHLSRRRGPHRGEPLLSRHPQRALQSHPAGVARDLRRPEPRPLHPKQGALGRGAVRGAGRPRLLPGSRAGYPLPLPIPVRRPSDAQSPGHRDEHRRAGPRAADLRRHGVGREDGPGRLPRLHAAGRRRAGRRLQLGGRHGRRALPAGQPDRHPGPQHPADHGPHPRRMQQRAAGREIPRVRLDRAHRERA